VEKREALLTLLKTPASDSGPHFGLLSGNDIVAWCEESMVLWGTASAVPKHSEAGAALEVAEKAPCFVILSEAKNLSSISMQAKKAGGILRFAQNDNVFFSLINRWPFTCTNQNSEGTKK
jgi:hypothetical protein